MAPENCERPRGQRSAETVRNRVARIEGLQSAGSKRAVGVIRARGFAAENVNIGADGFCAQASAAQKAAAAYRRENGVEVRNFFEKLFRGGGLTCDDAVVVVGVD